MEIFWILFAFIILTEIGLSFIGKGKKIRLLKCILYGAAAGLVLAVRSPQTGTDLASYYPCYEWISGFTFTETFTKQVYNYETGYVILNWLLSRVWADGQFIIIVMAIIDIWLVSWVIYRYSANVFLSFIIFITFGTYGFFFSGLRQALAIAITFASFHYLISGKHIKFVLLVLLATAMHNTAFIFLFIWPLTKLHLNKKKSFIILGLYILVIVPMLRIFLPVLTSAIFGHDRFANYQDGGGAITMAIVYTFVYLFSFMIKDDNSKIINSLRWIILLAVLFQWLGLISTSSITRICFYFSAFFCLFIPNKIVFLPAVVRRTIQIIAPALFIAFFWLSMSDGFLDVIPYHFCWETGYHYPIRPHY